MIFESLVQIHDWRRQIPDYTKIVATNGVFDLITTNHCDYLTAASVLGAYLIVGINSDRSVKKLKGQSRPINNEIDRAKVLDTLKPVDYVYIFRDIRADIFLDFVRPNIYVKGGDYNLDNMDKSELEVLKRHNTEIKFVNLYKGNSTTDIIEKIKNL